MTHAADDDFPGLADGAPLPDLSTPEARAAMFAIFTYLQSLEMADFVRLMSDFPKAQAALRAGDMQAASRHFGAMMVDVELAQRGEDDVRAARKSLDERRHGNDGGRPTPIGSGRAHFTEKRAATSGAS